MEFSGYHKDNFQMIVKIQNSQKRVWSQIPQLENNYY